MTLNTHRKPTEWIELDPAECRVIAVTRSEYEPGVVIGVTVTCPDVLPKPKALVNISSDPTAPVFMIRNRRGGRATARAYILRGMPEVSHD